MELSDWMAYHNMKMAEFARIIGVTRQVIWKVKRGLPVCPETAEKIYFATGGCVKPLEKPKGRQKGWSKR